MTTDDIIKYIELQLDLFLLLKVPNKKLTKTPRKVFIEHVLCQLEGIDINSTECIERIRERLGFFSNQDVWGYRWRLGKAGWFRKKGDDYEIMPNFNFTPENFKNSKTYKFTISYEAKEGGQENNQ